MSCNDSNNGTFAVASDGAAETTSETATATDILDSSDDSSVDPADGVARAEVRGDSIAMAGKGGDDGNDAEGDDGTTECVAERCGDGRVNETVLRAATGAELRGAVGGARTRTR